MAAGAGAGPLEIHSNRCLQLKAQALHTVGPRGTGASQICGGRYVPCSPDTAAGSAAAAAAAAARSSKKQWCQPAGRTVGSGSSDLPRVNSDQCHCQQSRTTPAPAQRQEPWNSI